MAGGFLAISLLSYHPKKAIHESIVTSQLPFDNIYSVEGPGSARSSSMAGDTFVSGSSAVNGWRRDAALPEGDHAAPTSFFVSDVTPLLPRGERAEAGQCEPRDRGFRVRDMKEAYEIANKDARRSTTPSTTAAVSSAPRHRTDRRREADRRQQRHQRRIQPPTARADCSSSRPLVGAARRTTTGDAGSDQWRARSLRIHGGQPQAHQDLNGTSVMRMPHWPTSARCI